MVSLFLCHKSDGSIKVDANLSVRAPVGKEAPSQVLGEYNYGPYSGWARAFNFAERSTIIDALQDGALVIQVQMWQSKPTLPPYLKNPFGKMILKAFMDEESADVMFEVAGEQVKSFPAHRLVLQ